MRISTLHLHQHIDYPDQNINKETLELNYTIDQMDLTDIYITCHPTAAEYTLHFGTWDILQDKPDVRTQCKTQQIQLN